MVTILLRISPLFYIAIISNEWPKSAEENNFACLLEKDFNQSAETDFKLGITSLSLTSDYRKINWRNVSGDVHSRYSCKLNFGKFIGKRLPWSSFSHQSFNFLQRCFIQ